MVVEEFILGHEGKQREILQFFHLLLSEELNLRSKISYKIPFYYRKKWVCYMNPIQGDKIELVFIRGRELSNHHGLLHSKERKMVAGIEISSLSDLPYQEILETIHEAILLDDTPAPNLRKK